MFTSGNSSKRNSRGEAENFALLASTNNDGGGGCGGGGAEDALQAEEYEVVALTTGSRNGKWRRSE